MDHEELKITLESSTGCIKMSSQYRSNVDLGGEEGGDLLEVTPSSATTTMGTCTAIPGCKPTMYATGRKLEFSLNQKPGRSVNPDSGFQSAVSEQSYPANLGGGGGSMSPFAGQCSPRMAVQIH
jgi:hypothetical protein